MVIVTPFSKASSSKSFVLDLVTTMKPDIIYVDERFILSNPENVSARYKDMFKDTTIRVVDINTILRRVHPEEKVLYLTHYDRLIKALKSNEALAEHLEGLMLYPNDYDICVDVTRLTDLMEGAVC